MARMGSKVLMAVVTIFAVVEAARIRRESDDCDKITIAHEECVKLAYDNYVAAHGAGDDGRGDWEARKSCNYVNSAVGECGDVLSGCYAEDEVDARKDHQVEAILDQLERVVGGWDSSKCPVISEYLERQSGDDEDGEEAADQDDEEAVEDGGMYAEEEEDAAEDDAQEEDGDEGAEEVNVEESDGEEGDAEEGDAEEVDGGEGEDEEGDESEDVEDGGADAEDDEKDEDAEEGADEEEEETEEGGDDEDEDAEEGGDEEEEDTEEGGDEDEEDDESSSPILISSFTMVLTCLLAA